MLRYGRRRIKGTVEARLILKLKGVLGKKEKNNFWVVLYPNPIKMTKIFDWWRNFNENSSKKKCISGFKIYLNELKMFMMFHDILNEFDVNSILKPY